MVTMVIGKEIELIEGSSRMDNISITEGSTEVLILSVSSLVDTVSMLTGMTLRSMMDTEDMDWICMMGTEDRIGGDIAAKSSYQIW